MPDGVATKFDLAYAHMLAPRDPIPLIRGWNRLEGRPRVVDFERSLRAEVRDSLWFLTRQWQYGEFQGEDAGSPIEASLAVRTSPLDAYQVAEFSAAYDPDLPLEVRVEREPVPFDLMQHMQISRRLQRLLQAQGLPGAFAAFTARFPLVLDSVAGIPSAEAEILFAAGREFLLDGATLLSALSDGAYDVLADDIAAGNASMRTKLDQVRLDLRAWHGRLYAQPDSEPNAWRPQRLEYNFAITSDAAQVKLTAAQYPGGHLDWYAFDAASMQSAATPAATVVQSFIPAGISFAGMPSARYWEMESSRTEFGHLDVNTNDLARLVLAEFILMYSNDWCVVPLELPVGSLTQIDGIVVTDVFGEQMLVRPADGGGGDGQPWTLFRHSGDARAASAAGMLLTPALMKSIDAPPLEQVRFLRDEMANLVWGVEARVMMKLGEGVPGQLPEPPTAIPAAVDADVARYILGTQVPEHWRPFIPVHLPGSLRSIRLQRARLPTTHTPLRAEILRVPGPYFIDEEQIPRAGRHVTRSFQRARWVDGKTLLWVGRKSSTGRGEGSSGLVFDHIDDRRR